ncbi:hypothetical protein ABZV61_28810 [Streptomyces sp900116325]|uniref:Uncharacterized protein n=1 Tax=Streptomyces sp. 900116325 TaxID=3154295 RepID=A0ABV2UIX5_9ACTN
MGLPSPTGRAKATFSPTPVTVAPVTVRDGRSREAAVVCTLDGPISVSAPSSGARSSRRRNGARRSTTGRLYFAPHTELAGRLAGLAAAEQGCWAFFDFTLHLTPDALQLDVRAPGSATERPAGLFGGPA